MVVVHCFLGTHIFFVLTNLKKGGVGAAGDANCRDPLSATFFLTLMSHEALVLVLVLEAVASVAARTAALPCVLSVLLLLLLLHREGMQPSSFAALCTGLHSPLFSSPLSPSIASTRAINFNGWLLSHDSD